MKLQFEIQNEWTWKANLFFIAVLAALVTEMHLATSPLGNMYS